MSADLHRSYLYAPGSRPELLAKALAAGADAVVLDLEDAVAPADKPAARRAVAGVVAGRHPCAVHVRVNRDGDGWSAEDVRAVLAPGLDALRLPKAETATAVQRLDALLTDLEVTAGLPAGQVRLYPTVESARGVLAAAEVLTASPRMARPAFGASDFLADVGARGEEDLATLHARGALVLASRVAGTGPPVDSVHTAVADLDGLRAAALRARALGFFGKSVIHPGQLPVVHEAFTPTADEVAFAERVVRAAEGAAATTVDGQFVDAAVVARSRSLMALKEAVDAHR